jgi:hypothetical protein
MCLTLVKNALVILLLMVATVSQPLLAIPATCQMPGKCPAVTCAGCCAVNPCCAPSDQMQSSPLSAVTAANAGFLAAIILQPLELPLPTARRIEFSKFALAFNHAHSPPPLAASCIRLI